MPFTMRKLGKTGITVSPFGIGGGYGASAKVLESGLEAGINTFFFAPIFPTYTPMMLWIRALPPSKKEKINIFSASYFWRIPYSIERTVKRHLSWLKAEKLDVFFLGWTSSISQDSTFDTLLKLKDRKLIRYIGISAHNRKLIPEMIKKYPIDVVMVRYNIIHRGAENEVFPYIKDQGLIAFNALKHGAVLKQNKNWDESKGKFPSAEEAYRFVLSNNKVHLCIAGPRRTSDTKTLQAAISGGPLDEERKKELCAYGNFLYQQKVT